MKKNSVTQKRAHGIYVSLRYLNEEALRANFRDLAKLIEAAAVAAREICIRVCADGKSATRREPRVDGEH